LPQGFPGPEPDWLTYEEPAFGVVSINTDFHQQMSEFLNNPDNTTPYTVLNMDMDTALNVMALGLTADNVTGVGVADDPLLAAVVGVIVARNGVNLLIDNNLVPAEIIKNFQVEHPNIRAEFAILSYIMLQELINEQVNQFMAGTIDEQDVVVGTEQDIPLNWEGIDPSTSLDSVSQALSSIDAATNLDFPIITGVSLSPEAFMVRINPKGLADLGDDQLLAKLRTGLHSDPLLSRLVDQGRIVFMLDPKPISPNDIPSILDPEQTPQALILWKANTINTIMRQIAENEGLQLPIDNMSGSDLIDVSVLINEIIVRYPNRVNIRQLIQAVQEQGINPSITNLNPQKASQRPLSTLEDFDAYMQEVEQLVELSSRILQSQPIPRGGTFVAIHGSNLGLNLQPNGLSDIDLHITFPDSMSITAQQDAAEAILEGIKHSGIWQHRLNVIVSTREGIVIHSTAR
jgi:hypothetical protein